MEDEPVRVVPYDPGWPAMFEAERGVLEARIGPLAARFGDDREAYTEHKGPFVRDVLSNARGRAAGTS
jgi:GrpB-like predicted nucleotidyltransferase (UPF0157 family)